MLPVAVIILQSYIFGFPVLSALGLSKHANRSVVLASIIHVLNLIVLSACGIMNIITLGIATSVAEFVILVYRVTVVIKNKNLLS